MHPRHPPLGSRLLQAPLPLRTKRGRALFVDLDGVLADFDRGCTSVTGRAPELMHPREMWPALARVRGGFFQILEPMADAHILWAYCVKFEPVSVLTGAPLGKWAEPQKRKWCEEWLGLPVDGERVIVCLARDKYKYCSPGAVLVDDREANRAAWELAGGTFVLHINAARTIQLLQELGFV